MSSESVCSDSEDPVGDEVPFDDSINGTGFDDYRPLDAEDSEVLCFRVTMGDGTSAGQQGNVIFTFEATQERQS